MRGGRIDLSIERLVLDGIAIPADDVPRLEGLVEAELRRVLDGGGRSSVGSPAAELEPLVLSTPPDVPSLARALAERIADRAAAEGGWDG